MTTIARRIVSEPKRLATQTWAVIVDLIAPEEGAARTEILSVTGIASSLISAEAMKDSPIVVYGSGPRVRIYCLYGDDAISGENADEAALVSSPVKGNWLLSLPCHESDLDWASTALKKKSSRITVRNLLDPVEDESGKSTSSKTTGIDTEAFFNL